ncbi:MAG TPA: Ku protein [Ferruginibacter sp.]|nr:Ku protein [Ferruginibacter sp.]
MKSLWTGTIGFGLVNVPVKLFSATKNSSLDLDMLDKKDLSNIKFKRVNEKTGKEVDWNNIVKGYFINDKYVVLTDKDFESVSAVKSKVIEINDFVSAEEIDSVYYEMPYYLVPERSGVRAYALLREALEKTGKVGIATFVMRSKESLAILRASKNVIILNRVRFAEEILDTKGLGLPEKATIKANELKMAVSLINQLSGKFNIAKYKDEYSGQLLKLIRAKAKGKAKAPVVQMKANPSKTKDLMDQLKASLSSKSKKVS